MRAYLLLLDSAHYGDDNTAAAPLDALSRSLPHGLLIEELSSASSSRCFCCVCSVVERRQSVVLLRLVRMFEVVVLFIKL